MSKVVLYDFYGLNGKLSWAQIRDFVIIIFEGFAVKTTDFSQKSLKI